MKVLMLGWEYPPDVSGGLGTACKGLSDGLVKEGHTIYFVIPKTGGNIKNDKFELIGADNVLLSGVLNASFFKFLNTMVPLSNSKNISYLEGETYKFKGGYHSNLFEEVYWYAVAVAKLAAQLKFDVIHAHDWITYLAGIIAKQISKKPLVVHVHATEFDRSNSVNRQVFEIEKLGMQTANKVIAVSNFTKKIILNNYGINEDKVITAYNGVTNNYNHRANNIYKKSFNEKVVTFLGRVTYQKGPQYFIEAAEKVFEKDKNVRFVMAGMGDLLPKMIKLVAKKHLSSHFHFTGFLKGDEVAHMLAISDVFVMPSVSEPFGITPLEAINLNIPVIISKQSGVSEVLPHAIAINYWETENIAEAIFGLLHYKSFVTTIRNFDNNNLKNLTWEKAAGRVSAAYLSVA